MTMRKPIKSIASALAIALLAALALFTSDSATAQDKAPKEIRYSHEVHEKVGVDHGKCETCHVLDSKFTVLAPTLGKNHQPCNDSECHATEYFAKKPTICIVCHTDSRPWIKQEAMLRQRKTSEFGGDLSHKTHATARIGGSGANGACIKCHGDVYKGTPARGGHDDCASCHAKKSKPRMSECGGCHRMGARKARASGKVGEWSVAALFAHNTHGRDPRKPQTDTECTTCHQTIPAATKLAKVKNPTMKSCDACHDGKSAFKTTGFECYRCHGTKAP